MLFTPHFALHLQAELLYASSWRQPETCAESPTLTASCEAVWLRLSASRGLHVLGLRVTLQGTVAVLGLGCAALLGLVQVTLTVRKYDLSPLYT